ncbi:MAG TPA: HEAT repeat domain-containing protein [Verrucomicrobiae bacterium]|nr:HEAT repeat domain-containing protein [Verrucomicrobiae bacterium]
MEPEEVLSMINRLLARIVLFFVPAASEIVEEARRTLFAALTVPEFDRYRWTDEDLLWVIDHHAEPDVRQLATRRLKSKATVTRLLRSHPDEPVRLACLGLVEDQTLLVDCANTDRSEQVRLAAARCVNVRDRVLELQRSPFADVRLVAHEWLSKNQPKQKRKRKGADPNVN